MRARDLLRNLAQLTGLWAVAVAQPLFQVLESGEAFVLARWRGGDIVLFALAVAFAFPLLMTGLEALVARWRPAVAGALHVALVTGVVAILAAYAVKQETALSGALALALVAVAGAVAAYLFVRAEVARTFTAFLWPAAPLFAGLFLFASPVRHLVLPAEGAELGGPSPPAPVVLVVFDEFPLLSLLDGRGELDARSHPAFARLARDGTWFRHATAVADFTPSAVPAILTGRHQDGSRPASASAHPDNLLALLGRRGGAAAQEDLTRLCPRDVCAANAPPGLPRRLTRALPALAKVSLATFLPDALYRRLPETRPFPLRPPEQSLELTLAGLGAERSVHYLHIQTPHQPWVRLPSGRGYPSQHESIRDFLAGLPDVPARTGIPSFGRARLTRDSGRAAHFRQRHLAQVRYADRLLGRLLDRLRAEGLYDRALVVVTADHGIAFEAGEDIRRLSEATAPGVLFVPLFVKLPGQRRRSVSNDFVQSIDIAPTVAAALGLRLPWEVDGRSVVDGAGRERDRLVAHAVEEDRRLELDPRALARRLRVDAAEQAALFHGRDPDRIFRAGPRGDLVGRRVADLPSGASSGLRYSLPGDPRAVDSTPAAGFVRALFVGSLAGPQPAQRPLALAIDGRIAATMTSHASGAGTRFEALVSEAFLPRGRHTVALFELVLRPGAQPVLRSIPPSSAPRPR